MNTANLSYTLGVASGEIILLLLLSFLLGMLLCWLLIASRLCCRRRKPTYGYTVAHTAPAVTPVRPTDDFDITPVTTSLHSPLVQPSLDTVEDIPAPLYQQQDIVELDPLLLNVDPFKPIIAPPDTETAIDTMVIDLEPKPVPDIPETKSLLTGLDPLLISIDPHKPIIDPPDMDTELELPTMQTEIQTPTPEIDPLLASIDPHKPIINPPDTVLDRDTDMPETPSTSPPTSHTLNDWLHKAKESVEHLSEKAAPTANDWLHKAKEKVEHLTEKATPTASEWLHKAKEIGTGFTTAKGNIIESETLAKSGSTLAALAASAKVLTEKLARSLSIHQDDLQKLKGIGPTFASILHRAGIHTYQQLAETSPLKLRSLLIVEDEQFSQHDTSSWPQQAALAAQGEWDKLQEYQNTLPTS